MTKAVVFVLVTSLSIAWMAFAIGQTDVMSDWFYVPLSSSKSVLEFAASQNIKNDAATFVKIVSLDSALPPRDSVEELIRRVLVEESQPGYPVRYRIFCQRDSDMTWWIAIGQETTRAIDMYVYRGRVEEIRSMVRVVSETNIAGPSSTSEYSVMFLRKDMKIVGIAFLSRNNNEEESLLVYDRDGVEMKLGIGVIHSEVFSDSRDTTIVALGQREVRRILPCNEDGTDRNCFEAVWSLLCIDETVEEIVSQVVTTRSVSGRTTLLTDPEVFDRGMAGFKERWANRHE